MKSNVSRYPYSDFCAQISMQISSRYSVFTRPIRPYSGYQRFLSRSFLGQSSVGGRSLSGVSRERKETSKENVRHESSRVFERARKASGTQGNSHAKSHESKTLDLFQVARSDYRGRARDTRAWIKMAAGPRAWTKMAAGSCWFCDLHRAREECYCSLYTNSCIILYLRMVIIVFVLYKKIRATWSKPSKTVRVLCESPNERESGNKINLDVGRDRRTNTDIWVNE